MLRVTVSVVDSHRSDDSGSKVRRWPTFGGVTVPEWMPLSGDTLDSQRAHMGGQNERSRPPRMPDRVGVL